MPDWSEELTRIEMKRAEAETKLDNALRHLAEVQANQIERDNRFAALLEGLRESESLNGDQPEEE